MIGGGSLGHLNTFTIFLFILLLLYTTHINTCYVLLTEPMYTMHKISEHSHLVAIVDCDHIESATASFED